MMGERTLTSVARLCVESPSRVKRWRERSFVKFEEVGVELSAHRITPVVTITAPAHGRPGGTWLGAVFGEMFPERLDRNVLDSSMNPRLTWREGDAHNVVVEVYYRDMRAACDAFPHGNTVGQPAPNQCAFDTVKDEPLVEVGHARYPQGLVLNSDGDTQTSYVDAKGWRTRWVARSSW
jgi:hypothetical protein